MTDVNFAFLPKSNEYYFFTWNDATRIQVLRTMGRWASNPELSFTWYDAARLAKTVREAGKKRPRWVEG